MNRLCALILLGVLVTPAFGQKTNPQLRQLEDRLRQYSHGMEFHQSNDIAYDSKITYRWKATYDVLAPIHRILTAQRTNQSEEAAQQAILKTDSIYAATRRQLDEDLDTIRATFKSLSREATESYMYEYHQDGADTINYSIAFDDSKGKPGYPRFGNVIQFWNAHEVASFSYVSRKEDILFPDNPDTKLKGALVDRRSYGNYSHIYEEPRGIPKEETKPFDIAAFEAHIQPALKPLMKLQGAKSYPVYWQHDKGYKDEVGSYGSLLYGVRLIEDWPAGLTTGTYYFIPAQHKADPFYDRLDSLAHDYVNHHPEQPYRYHHIPIILRVDRYGSIYSDVYFHINDIVESDSDDTDDINSTKYNLRCYQDDDGLHILSLTTKGILWIPKGFQKMKRWVNGKATYRK